MPQLKKRPIKLMLPKNIGAIQISNDLTLVERKVMNVILWNAFNIEKDTINNEKSFNKNNKKFYSIDISHIEDILNWEKYVNRVEIKKALDKLVSTSLKFNILSKQNTDGGRWNITTALLSEVVTQDDNSEIYYAFSNSIKDVIIKPTLYGWINLEEQRNIESRYTLALLEYLQGSIAISKRTATSTEYIAIEDYRKLVAGDKCNYDTFKHINQKLIQSPLKELNKKSDITAKANFQKKGRKVVSISFDVQKEKFVQQELYLEEGEATNNIQNNKQENTIHKSAEERKINELMITYNVSEKKRKQFIETFDHQHIKENIKYLTSQPEWKSGIKKLPTGLIIKAIEDNYANYGTEKQNIKERQKYIFQLREILNPIFDKTGSNFLRNILQDYQIYQERKDKENAKKYQDKLKTTLKQIEDLTTNLLKNGFTTEQEIMEEIGIHTDEDYKRILFFSKEEIQSMAKGYK